MPSVRLSLCANAITYVVLLKKVGGVFTNLFFAASADNADPNV